MAETFDPYRKWLGIPPSQQPPHHYRLLGIELFEEDVEVIDTAASQRMSYLQEVGNGPQVKESQRLLNEVSGARRCLLDAAKKKAYDAELRAKLAAAAPAPTSSVAPPPVVPAVRAKRLADDDDETVTINLKDVAPTGRSKSAGAKTLSSAGKSASSKAAATPNAASTAKPDETADAKPKPRKKRNPIPMLVGLFVLIGAVAGGTLFVLLQRGADNGNVAVEDDTPVEHVAVVPPRANQTATLRNAYTPAQAPTAEPPAASSRSTTAAVTTADPSPVVSFFPLPNASPTATVPKATPSATAPVAAPSGAPTDGTAVAAANAAIPAVPTAPPATSFFGIDQAAVPDVRPHFLPAGLTLRELRGLTQDGGIYHLFYDAVKVERRTTTDVWGHAVSRDLFLWSDVEAVTPPVPVAQKPSLGCVVVDRENASGLGKADSPPLLALFTYASSGDSKKGIDVGLMYSVDKGKTWTPHEKNPLLKGLPATAGGPQLIRHAASMQWGMLLYVSTVTPPSPPAVKGKPTPPPTEPPKSTYRLFSSADLTDWKQQQEILYPAGAATAHLLDLADNGSSGGTRWMFLHGRTGRYWLGDYDGEKFTTDRSGGGVQTGGGYFGFRTLGGGDRKNVPILAVVASSDTGPATGSGVAFPRRLQLQGQAILPNRDAIPAAWNGAPKQWSNRDLDPTAPLSAFEGGALFRVQLQVQADQAEQLRVSIFGLPVVFDFKNKKYQVGTRPAADYASPVVQIEGVVDVDLAELNIGGGVGAVAFRTASGPDARTPLELKAVGGKARILSLIVTPLKPPKPVKP